MDIDKKTYRQIFCKEIFKSPITWLGIIIVVIGQRIIKNPEYKIIGLVVIVIGVIIDFWEYRIRIPKKLRKRYEIKE